MVADVASFRPGSARFALVLATYYWDEDAFTSGCTAVMDGGLIGWEALTKRPGAGLESTRPWEIEPGSLSARLPPDFEVIDDRAMDVEGKMSTRILARRNVSSHDRDGG